MEAYHIKQTSEGPIRHAHSKNYADCLVVPSEKVVLYSVQRGTFGGRYCGLDEREEIFEEMMGVIRKGVAREGVNYSDAKKKDIDPLVLARLVSDARKFEQLRTSVKNGLKEILDSSK